MILLNICQNCHQEFKAKPSAKRKFCSRKCWDVNSVLLHVHHIDYNKDNINTDNLITLCKYCHGKMHGNSEDRIKWKNQLLSLLEEFPPMI
jgi:5-methylcytosine-specific restriction endonuclease McrA